MEETNENRSTTSECVEFEEKDDFQNKIQAMFKMEVSAITRSVHESASDLKNDIGGLKHEIRALRSEVHEVKQKCADIGDRCTFVEDKLSSLEERYDSRSNDMIERMQKLEDWIERLEGFSRRNNLRFFGVPEAGNDDFISCSRLITNILNSVYKEERKWDMADIERAHRVGEKREDRPRTIIVKMLRWSDKMHILNNTGIRDKLRQKGVRAASDLTNKQAADLNKVRQSGKFGYFKGGRLVVRDGPRAQASALQSKARTGATRQPSPTRRPTPARTTRHSPSTQTTEPLSPASPSPRHPTPSPSPPSSKGSSGSGGRQRSPHLGSQQRTYANVTRKGSITRPSLDGKQPQRSARGASAAVSANNTHRVQTRARMQSTHSTDFSPRGRQSRIDSHVRSSRRDR